HVVLVDVMMPPLSQLCLYTPPLPPRHFRRRTSSATSRMFLCLRNNIISPFDSSPTTFHSRPTWTQRTTLCRRRLTPTTIIIHQLDLPPTPNKKFIERLSKLRSDHLRLSENERDLHNSPKPAMEMGIFFKIRKNMTEVLEAMEQKMSSEDVTWPKTRFTGPTRPRSDIYCRFHRDYGHTVENCRHLKDEIERLIQAGHLKEFVYHDKVKGRGRRRCREDSEERSDRGEEGDDRDGRDGRGKRPRRDGEQGGEALVKRITVYMISGGPTDGDFNKARKEHARAVKRKREEVGITAHMPVISFKAENAAGVVLPHNDALVITAEVAVMPMGKVSLPVALGSEVTRNVWMVRFVVVGAESSYNIIMGRTSLNAFQAVVSTYHLMIKYPVGENIGEIAGDQLTSRSYYQTTVSNNTQLARRQIKPKEEKISQPG
ncbi:Unknown protein, partial [Striga hermonthica]